MTQDGGAAEIGEPAESCLIIATQHGLITAAMGDTFSVCGWQPDKLIGKQIVTTVIPRQYRMAHIQGLTRYHLTGQGPMLGRILPMAATDPAGAEYPVWLTVFSDEHSGCVFGYLQRRHA